MGYHRKQKERETSWTEREREKGEDAVFSEKEDKSLIDVENVETTGEKCCHLSWLTNTYHWTVQCVRSSEAHFTYINYVYHSNVFEADNIYTQKTPTKWDFTNIFCYFYFALGLHTWLCWLLKRSQIPSCPRDSFKRVHDWCIGWAASAGCPPTKSWLLRWKQG